MQQVFENSESIQTFFFFHTVFMESFWHVMKKKQHPDEPFAKEHWEEEAKLGAEKFERFEKQLEAD